MMAHVLPASSCVPKRPRGPAGLFSLCSGGDTVAGVKSWQWGAQEPSYPRRDDHSELRVGLFCVVGEASHHGFR